MGITVQIWSDKDAKARFSALLDACLADGPLIGADFNALGLEVFNPFTPL
jgi:hypothetical protein